MNAYLGIDIGSISTKGVILDDNDVILASDYLCTEGDPMGGSMTFCADGRSTGNRIWRRSGRR